MNNSKGQALLETIICVPIIAALIVMISFFCNAILTKQQLLMAARYGTDLIVYTDMDENQVRNEVRDYLCDNNAKGRKLNSNNLRDEDIKVSAKRFPKLGSADVYRKAATIFQQYYNPKQYTSSVEIFYSIRVPKVFELWGRWFGSRGGMPRNITVSARSEVLAGTGA